MHTFFDLKVSLVGVRPPIWRRFLLSAGSRFINLHEAIQAATGWESRHLFCFSKPDTDIGTMPIAGIPAPEDIDLYGRKVPDARKLKLATVLGADKLLECTYRYDFGDDWCLRVQVEGQPELPEIFHRRLLGGERAFPPEDCGGIGGYERLLEVVHEGKDPWNEDLVATMEWLGNWDPDRCDLDELRSRFAA